MDEKEQRELRSKRREAEERAKSFVLARQRAYLETFDPKSELNQQVLSDLAAFCRADESTFHIDARAHALMEGRREVWLRIQQHLKMDSETLWKLISRKGA